MIKKLEENEVEGGELRGVEVVADRIERRVIDDDNNNNNNNGAVVIEDNNNENDDDNNNDDNNNDDNNNDDNNNDHNVADQNGGRMLQAVLIPEIVERNRRSERVRKESVREDGFSYYY